MWRILRARRLSDTARATLGVAVTASQPEIKQAYRALARVAPGPAPRCEQGARRGEVRPSSRHTRRWLPPEWAVQLRACGAAASPAASRRFRAQRPQQSAAFTFTSYLGFRGRPGTLTGTRTLHTRRSASTPNARRMWAGVGTFILGLAAINLSAARDRRLKASGDLVDAWFNQATRRWETPPPHMHRTLSCKRRLPQTASHVYRASSARGGRRAGAFETLDGSTAEHSYLARQRGDKT